jgi:nitroimidazol reductase NimA-like FMN-containing flavoprotein (pyridoxamine 5'-phosphate oxidase superfamily)
MAWSKAKQMKFLSDAPVIRVATMNRRCKPQVAPVCHVVWTGKIYWSLAAIVKNAHSRLA